MLHLQLSTIIFQILNFLILLAALGWFLYRPLLRVMREREQSIADRIRRADEQEQAAASDQARIEEEKRATTVEMDSLLASARTSAAEEREHVLALAKVGADRMTDEALRASAERERLALSQAQGRIRQTAVQIAGTLIRQTAGDAVHAELLRRFLAQGVQFGDRQAGSAASLGSTSGATVEVELAYPPDATTEAEIRAVLIRDLALPDPENAVGVHVEPTLLAGLRISAGEFVFDFSLRRSLERLSEAAEGSTTTV